MMHKLFLKEPERKIGTKSLLFDRFSTIEQEDINTTILNREQTIKSIIHEVESILNTRLTGKDSFFSKTKRSKNQKGLPIAFGLRDFHSIDPSNHFDRLKFQKTCQKTIELFETRLKNIRVLIKSFDSRSQKLNISISGDLNLYEFEGQINFPMDLDYGWIR